MAVELLSPQRPFCRCRLRRHVKAEVVRLAVLLVLTRSDRGGSRVDFILEIWPSVQQGGSFWTRHISCKVQSVDVVSLD